MSSINEDKIKVILKHFNFTCRTFTSVMMLKLELQKYLFDKDMNEAEINDTVAQLTHLETAAATLNDIAVSACMTIIVN